LLLPSTPAKCCQRFADEIISRDNKYRVWLWIRNIDNTQVPARVGATQRNPSALAAGRPSVGLSKISITLFSLT
jgi:hypothetical protein